MAAFCLQVFSQMLNKRIFWIVCLLAFLPGCATISGWRDAAALKAGYTSKAKAELELSQVKSSFDVKLTTSENNIKLANEKVIQGLMDKLQNGGDLLYGADFANWVSVVKPDRTRIIMDNKINETRVLMPPPTVKAMAAQNENVRKQLDETLTSLDELKMEHQKTIDEMKVISDKEKQSEVDLANAKQIKRDLEKQKSNAILAKENALQEISNQVIAQEHERGDNAKARQATLEKMSLYAGLFSVLCFAGAIYLPIYKAQIGILGIIVGMAAVGIWYITPLICGITALVIITGILGWMIYNHNIATKTNTALVNAVQDVKEKAPEIYTTTIKPALTAWTTTYTKDSTGATITIPDKSVTANIDSHLVASNRV